MPIRPVALALSSFFLAALTTGCAPVAAPAQTAQVSTGSTRPHTPEDRRLYRFDFVVSAHEAGKAPSNSAFTLNLEEDRGGDVSVGSNVPLQTAGSQSMARMDIGLKLRCSFVQIGDGLLLHDTVEMSTADELPAIRKLVTNGDSFIAPGKSVLVASLEDANSRKSYEVTVTATKLH